MRFNLVNDYHVKFAIDYIKIYNSNCFYPTQVPPGTTNHTTFWPPVSNGTTPKPHHHNTSHADIDVNIDVDGGVDVDVDVNVNVH